MPLRQVKPKKLRRAARRAGVIEATIKLINECACRARSLSDNSIYPPRYTEQLRLGWFPAHNLSEAIPATASRTDVAWALRSLIRAGAVEECRVEGDPWIRLVGPLQALAKQAV